jgi:hypothetical protein
LRGAQTAATRRGSLVDLEYRLWASPTVLDGPRLAMGGKETMWLLNAHGLPETGWPQPMHGWPDATAAYAPGLLSVTTLTPGDPSQGWLYAWDEAGHLLPGFPLELAADSDSSPALADLDGDGRRWIIFGDDAGWLHVVDTAGRERHGFPVRSAGPRPGPTPTPHPPGGNIYSIGPRPPGDLTATAAEIAAGSWTAHASDAAGLLPGWLVAGRSDHLRRRWWT